ncbi:DUF4870 domain-containing protein [Flavobacterium sp. 7A]|uniref:DUF4870 domain-containing protein n=1 Tax=Flavobacterium sp. 7A TaxID=2940571 RepID=UPI00222723AB|nr:DUF4870 domain-containing protein [Flavobacterium sp. 7A]MCW2119532.1 putative Tic20 family protein [Flavobacterium sp. 7A]
MQTRKENNIAAITHLSALGQYIIPLGNLILPLLLWNYNKKESTFIDNNGKQVLNFQFSILLYTIVLLLVIIPIVLFSIFNNINLVAVVENHELILQNLDIGHNINIITVAILALLILASLKVVEFVYILYGTLKASNGEAIKYPLSISFLK